MAGVDDFMAAISGQESGGNAQVVNKDSGAHGEFQIMPANWAPWAAEAGLGANAPKTQENQRAVARFKMEQYYKQFGSWEAVAVAWYAGPGTAARYAENPKASGWTAPQGSYPSIASYVQQVMGRMGGGGGGAIRDTPGGAQPVGPPARARIDVLSAPDLRGAFGELGSQVDDDDMEALRTIYQMRDDDDEGEDESTVGPYNVARLSAQRETWNPDLREELGTPQVEEPAFNRRTINPDTREVMEPSTPSRPVRRPTANPDRFG